MSVCQYKNMFGKPNTGLHNYRVFNFAVVDVVLTVVLAVLICYIYGCNLNMYTFSAFRKSLKNVLFCFICLMIIAIVLHRIFCVNTTLNLFLFGKL